jgi:hypothetical protein
MKSKYIYTILILTNFVTIFLLARAYWAIQMWEGFGSIEAQYAAELQAENHFIKGILIEYRLVVLDEAEASISRPLEFNGPFLVLNWPGYRLPMCESPTIQMGKVFVEAHNREMKDMYHNPENYEKRRKLEIENWENQKAEHAGSKMDE